MKIWLLHITHKHGDNYSAHASREGAEAAMESYCREWWEEGPVPTENLVERYFEEFAGMEFGQIEELSVEGEVPCSKAE